MQELRLCRSYDHYGLFKTPEKTKTQPPRLGATVPFWGCGSGRWLASLTPTGLQNSVGRCKSGRSHGVPNTRGCVKRECVGSNPRTSRVLFVALRFRLRSLRVPNLLWTDEPQRDSFSPYSFSSPLTCMFHFGLTKEHYPCSEGCLVFSRMSVCYVPPCFTSLVFSEWSSHVSLLHFAFSRFVTAHSPGI